MLKVKNLFITSVLTVGLIACGADSESQDQGTAGTDSATTDGVDGSTTDGTDTGSASGTALVPFTCTNSEITEGENTNWQAGGEARSFYAYLPNVSSDTPVSVVYVSHGVGDEAKFFKNFVAPQPNADADFPYIVILPQGLDLQPIAMGGSSTIGIEWDIFESVTGDDNLESALFESVLGCLADQYTVDAERIYTWGFSGGAILTAMLHSRYPEMIGASYVMSGAWFNDRETADNIDTGNMVIPFVWDALNPADAGTILMTHGGAEDHYTIPMATMAGVGNGGRIISFEDSAGWAHTYLQSNNRTVIDCPHTSGHTNHPGMANSAVYEFFKQHRAGKSSAYLTDGLPGSLSSICTLNP